MTLAGTRSRSARRAAAARGSSEVVFVNNVVVKMIVDGHHLAAETVRLVWACAGGRIALLQLIEDPRF